MKVEYRNKLSEETPILCWVSDNPDFDKYEEVEIGLVYKYDGEYYYTKYGKKTKWKFAVAIRSILVNNWIGE